MKKKYLFSFHSLLIALIVFSGCSKKEIYSSKEDWRRSASYEIENSYTEAEASLPRENSSEKIVTELPAQNIILPVDKTSSSKEIISSAEEIKKNDPVASSGKAKVKENKKVNKLKVVKAIRKVTADLNQKIIIGLVLLGAAVLLAILDSILFTFAFGLIISLVVLVAVVFLVLGLIEYL